MLELTFVKKNKQFVLRKNGMIVLKKQLYKWSVVDGIYELIKKLKNGFGLTTFEACDMIDSAIDYPIWPINYQKQP